MEGIPITAVIGGVFIFGSHAGRSGGFPDTVGLFLITPSQNIVIPQGSPHRLREPAGSAAEAVDPRVSICQQFLQRKPRQPLFLLPGFRSFRVMDFPQGQHISVQFPAQFLLGELIQDFAYQKLRNLFLIAGIQHDPFVIAFVIRNLFRCISPVICPDNNSAFRPDTLYGLHPSADLHADRPQHIRHLLPGLFVDLVCLFPHSAVLHLFRDHPQIFILHTALNAQLSGTYLFER